MPLTQLLNTKPKSVGTDDHDRISTLEATVEQLTMAISSNVSKTSQTIEVKREPEIPTNASSLYRPLRDTDRQDI